MSRLYCILGFIGMCAFFLHAEESADPLQAQVENGLRAKDKPSDTKRYTIEERMRHYHMVGVSLAVVDKGKVAWQMGYGFLEAGKPERVTIQEILESIEEAYQWPNRRKGAAAKAE